MRPSLALAIVYGLLVAPRFLFASVVINEVLFDPAGTDTGLEAIEIYNPDAAAADLTGWELYPDGIGYFPFPSGFSLAATSVLVVHLRASGANDAANLYHPAATKNMSNTSGSVALFNASTHTKDTLIDFMEWSSKGASSTWESSAAGKGLWQKETPVNTAGFAEGSSVGLTTDGVRGDASAWKIYAAPSFGSVANAGALPPPSPQATSTSSAAPPPSAAADTPAGEAVPPSLRADAGRDISAIAGAIVPFHGVAFGLDGQPLPSARFLWNFGDGSVQEGKSLNHVYHFPGTYYANLAVQSGEYAGSDWRAVSVSAPALTLSEVRPGPDGFAELFNASAEPIELGGMYLEDDHKNGFRVPVATKVGAKSVIVFANTISGLNPEGALVLRDARLIELDRANFSGPIPGGASWERRGGDFVIASAPTPGAFVPLPAPLSARAGQAPPPLAQQGLRQERSPQRSALTAGRAEPRETAAIPRSDTIAPPARAPERASATAGIGSAVASRVFLGASVILGALAAAAFIAVKRILP